MKMEIGNMITVFAVLIIHITSSSSNLPEHVSCEYRMMTNFLQQLAGKYDHVVRLESIGLTDEDREIWTVIISDSPYHRPLLRPQVKFVGNVNGMSGPACYVLLRLAKHLVEQYENEASMERKLMETMEIHIIPNLNPDGYSRAVPGSCFGKEGRLNSNFVNLNTNFPDIFVDQKELVLQKETEAMMRWIEKNKFVVSVSVISGAKVVVYPFDSIPIEHIIGAPVGGQSHQTPDEDIFKHLALTFSRKSWASERDWNCSGIGRTFENGIINGAEWKPQSGTMMDYNYIHGTFEIMVGISCCRNENDVTTLDELWWRYREGLLHVIHEVQGGIRGQVLDSETYEAIEGAKLSRGGDEDNYSYEGLPHIPWFTSEQGEFWRPWRPGVYKLLVEKEGYKMKEVDVVVEQRQPSFIRVEMEKVIPTTTTTIRQTSTVPTVRTINNETDKKTASTAHNSKDSLSFHNEATSVNPRVMEYDNATKRDDAASTNEINRDEEKTSNSKHYLSLTQLDHSFINLLRGVQFKNSGTILKESVHVIIMMCLLVMGKIQFSAL